MPTTFRLGEPLPRNVVIVRALPGLGDFLCAVPAWRALRAALPGAAITLVGLPAVQPLVERFRAYLDGWIEFPGYPGIPEGPQGVNGLPRFLAHVHAQEFDLALQMHGSGTASNPFTVLLNARRAAGFYMPGEYCPDPELFVPYPDDQPEVRRHLRLLDHLGIPPAGEELEFPVLADDGHALIAALEGAVLAAGSYVVIHPGAADPVRRWSPANFATVADALARQGLQVVITGSTAEIETAAAVVGAMAAPAINLAGRTGLGALASLLADARLLVCNDTGVSHLGAALRTPSVVVFSASDPVRWAPLDRNRHRIVAPLGGSDHSLQHRAWAQGRPVWPPANPAAVLAEVRQLLLAEPADVA